MDDGSPLPYLFCIFLLILGGAFFAGTEIALASVSKIRMMSYADDGNKQAKRVLYIHNHFDRALTTLLIGNNIMHISCASLSTVMATRFFGSSAVTVATVLTTLAVFLFAEMIPKCFAKAFNEKFAMAVAGPLIFLMKLLHPVAFLFTKLSEFVSRPFRSHEEEEPTVTEDELYDIIDTVIEEGELDKEEGELMQNALEFAETEAHEIYTPWRNVVRVREDLSSKEILAVIQSCTHSRLVVVDAQDQPIGILQIRKYIKACLQDPKISLLSVMDDVNFVRGDMPIDDLMAAMSEKRSHLAVVLDKNSLTLGILTMEDILEELVGEIYDEDDPMEGGLQHV